MNKKSYIIKGFDCANCARKSEEHLSKHPKIKEAVIDFAGDRLHIEYKDEELSISEILDIIKEVEDDPITIEEVNAKKEYTYCITGFDCANCARKSEEHLNKNENIESAVIDFASDRLHISFKDKKLSPSEILNIIKEVEDDPIEITSIEEKKKKSSFFNKENVILLCRIFVAVIVMVISLTALNKAEYFWYSFAINVFALAVISYDVYFKVIKHIIAKENPIDEYLLMTLTSLGAFIVATVLKENHTFMF